MTLFRNTLFSAAAALALLASGAAGAAEPATKLTIGVIKMAALTDPWVAEKQGIFARNGLAVSSVEFNSGGDAISAAQSGSIDLFLAIPGTAMTAIERGFDFRAVFQNEIAKPAPPDSGSVQVLASSNLKTLSDLAGKTVAVSSLHSQNTVDLQLVLERAGVALNSVQLIEIPFPSQADVLKTGRVAAVATVDPYTTQLQTSGVGRVIGWNYVESIPQQPLGAWFAKRSFIAKNPAVIDAFNRSIKEAMDYMNSDPARARQLVTEYTGLAPELVKNMPMIGWDYHVDPAKWQAVTDMLVKRGELQKPHKAEDYFAPQILPYLAKGS